ncbi:MAG: PIN domain-containing protein [Chloroflexi bacterium]|nr:PIN domain-containing protein [Chloroflexota bacterium]
MASRPPSHLRVMLDTTVLLAGTIWPRFPYEVLHHALRGDFQAVLCPFILAQARRKFRELFPAHVEQFETFLCDLAYDEVPDPAPKAVAAHRGLMRDPTDLPIALAAINAGVDYLISDDKDFTHPAQPIHGQLAILQSGTFLNEVMGWTHEDLDRIKRRTWADVPDE